MYSLTLSIAFVYLFLDLSKSVHLAREQT